MKISHPLVLTDFLFYLYFQINRYKGCSTSLTDYLYSTMLCSFLNAMVLNLNLVLNLYNLKLYLNCHSYDHSFQNHYNYSLVIRHLYHYQYYLTLYILLGFQIMQFAEYLNITFVNQNLIHFSFWYRRQIDTASIFRIKPRIICCFNPKVIQIIY